MAEALADLGPLYKAEKMLGKGAEGSVYKGRYIGREPLGSLVYGMDVAIKVVLWEHVRPNEVMMQAQLRHLNIVTLYDVFQCASYAQLLVLPAIAAA